MRCGGCMGIRGCNLSDKDQTTGTCPSLQTLSQPMQVKGKPAKMKSAKERVKVMHHEAYI